MPGEARASMTRSEQHDLERFVAAQNKGGTFEEAVSELRRGRKASHWMHFISL
jgi:uncharacterized protein (DUF1810 family)